MHTSYKRGGIWLASLVICLTVVNLLSTGDRASEVGAKFNGNALRPARAARNSASTADAGSVHKENGASHLPTTSTAQAPDANTLLLLHFDGSLNGAQGETPTQATGASFQPGVSGQGVFLPAGNQLHYPIAGNINATEGTVELWIKPNWSPNDNQSQTILSWGSIGGILLFKNGSAMRIILNRFAGESDADVSILNWQPNQWHHLAFTWSNTNRSVKIYLDGVLSAQDTIVTPQPAINSSTFQIGADGSGLYLNAVIDDLRISSVERSAQEIANNMKQSLTINSWSFNPPPPNIEMYPGWYYWKSLNITASTNIGNLSLPVLAATWTSSNPLGTVMDVTGRIKALSPGVTTLTALLGVRQNSITVNVLAPVLPPEEETVDPFLAVPISGYLYKIPVMIINYLPTKDGINIDVVASGWTGTVAAMKANLARYRKQIKFQLEERSRFRGYNNPATQPALSYQVVKIINVYEDIPPWHLVGPVDFQPDYYNILTRFNAQHLVNNLGVKEFWIWGYHHGRIYPVESDMSSPITGDVSNSFRHSDDLPIFNTTYVLYNFNFARGDVNLHGQGHQLEAILSYVNFLRDGNTNLFWKQFSGQNDDGSFKQGRCGNVHFPPNATGDYDYSNTTLVNSDIQDWTPANTGQKMQVNVNTWRNLVFAWPGNQPPDDIDQANWLLYWMQNMPGRGSTIPYNANKMANWWHFTGDWDAAITSGMGLYEPGFCNYSISTTSQSLATNGGTGNVSVTCGGGCKWIASSNEPWITITVGKIGDGNGTVGFNVGANTGGARTGTIAIAGQVFTVTQPGSIQCTYTLGAASQSFAANGGTGSVNVATTSGCAWTAISNVTWITITAGISGNGNGAVNFSVVANPGPARTGTLTIAGQTFTATQAALPANTLPRITPAPPYTIGRCDTRSVVIATVSDNETPAGNLIVAANTAPSGITINNMRNNNGEITADIATSVSAAIGSNTLGLTVNDGGGLTATASFIINVASGENCLDEPIPPDSMVSDQKPGSILIYNLFTSNVTNPNLQDTKIRITNMHTSQPVVVHLFLVDGSNGTAAEAFICLAPNQTANYLASDVDPGVTGYVVAVAVNATTGCPISFNYLVGGAYVKFASGHAASLGAEAVAVVGNGLPTCTGGSTTATLNFDGVSYNRLPRMLAVDNISDRTSGNEMLLVINRIGGNLITGGNVIGEITGWLYNDVSQSADFNFNAGASQFRSMLSNTFPRTTPRFEQFIPAGRSGWVKFWSGPNIGILGAAINFNTNARAISGAFSGGCNLYRYALTSTTSLTIPVYPPSCQ